MRTGVYIGQRRSSYAFDLARAAGVKVLRRVPPLYVRRGGVIVNWGTALGIDCPLAAAHYAGAPVRTINKSAAVARAADKVAFFNVMNEVGDMPVVENTRDRNVAQEWANSNHYVVERHIVSGHGGAGVVVTAPFTNVGVARLYTKYFNGAREYRVHVWLPDDTYLVQQKRRRNGTTERSDGRIRNAGPEWAFCVNNVTTPTAGLIADCKRAVAELGLDFGAVDVRQKLNGDYRILEVNTAPGVEGTALQFYAQKVLDMVRA